MGSAAINEGPMWAWNAGSPRWEHVVGIQTGTTRHDPVPVSSSGNGRARLLELIDEAIISYSAFATEISADPDQAVQTWWTALSSTEKANYRSATKALDGQVRP